MNGRLQTATLAVAAIAIGLLQLGLPAETFFSGDCGVKLAVVQNALRSPLHPLALPLPRIGNRVLPYVDPLQRIHGDHAHAATPDLFPLLTAPLYAAFGPRGLYVLPAAGALVGLWAWMWIATMLDARRNASLAAATLVLSSPLLFYALEFWEHAAAFGVGSAGLAFLVAGRRAGRPGRLALLAGGCFGVAFLLRPESLLFAVAGVTSLSCISTAAQRNRMVGNVLAGCAVAVCPATVYNLAHFGLVSAPHLSVHARALVEGDWLRQRGELVSAWFGLSTKASFLRSAPLMPLVLLQAQAHRRFAGSGFLAVTAILFVVLAVCTAPSEGGAQWGPRYLLFAYGPLGVLAADSVQTLGGWRIVRTSVLAFLLLVGIWVQRQGYRELRGTKRIYAQVLDLVRDATPAGSVVVSDVWWLDEVAASAAGSRTFVYVRSQAESLAVTAALRASGIGHVTLIAASSGSPANLLRPLPACVESRRRQSALPALTAVRMTCTTR